jgi:hypothetical protein
VENRPRWWPEKEDWFIAVVDRIYADDWLAERMPPASPPAARGSSENPNEIPVVDNPDPEISAAIQSLAAAKKMR